MDDFVEMEKLALVSVDKLSRSSHVSSDEASGTLRPLQTGSNGNALKDIPKANLDQSHATQRNPDEMLEDIRVGLAGMGYPNAAESFDEKDGFGPS
ncbi:hypothetical protein V6N13_053321 [Hibiscus sabdariffa]